MEGLHPQRRISKLSGSAVRNHRAIEQQQLIARMERGGNVMRTHHDGAAFAGQPLKQISQEFLGGHVQPRERLIEEQ